MAAVRSPSPSRARKVSWSLSYVIVYIVGGGRTGQGEAVKRAGAVGDAGIGSLSVCASML